MGPSPPGVRVRKTRCVLSPRGLIRICRRKPRSSEPSDVPETPPAFVFLAGLPPLFVFLCVDSSASSAVRCRWPVTRWKGSLLSLFRSLVGWQRPKGALRSVQSAHLRLPSPLCTPWARAAREEGSGHVPKWEVMGFRGFSDRGTRAPLTF